MNLPQNMIPIEDDMVPSFVTLNEIDYNQILFSEEENHGIVTNKNVFENNSADQVDLDFVTGNVTQNIFNFKGDHDGKLTDGLDISGSVLNISNNTLQNMSDKGLSVGEKSRANVFNNNIVNNNIGIALKDGSEICLRTNSINKNTDSILTYIKKNMYQFPSLFIEKQDVNEEKLSWQSCRTSEFLQ